MEGVRLTLGGRPSTFDEISLDAPANNNSRSGRVRGSFRARNPHVKQFPEEAKWSARRTTAVVILASAFFWSLIILGVRALF